MEHHQSSIGSLEDKLHVAYANSHTSDFIERPSLLNSLDAFFCNGGGLGLPEMPLVLQGAVGVGKTAILANWVSRHISKSRSGPKENMENEFVFFHIVGCSRRSIDVFQTLRRLIKGIIRHFDLGFDESMSDDKLPWVLPRVLDAASKKGTVLMVIDGLHLMRGSGTGLKWLPIKYPRNNVKVIFSMASPNEKIEKDIIRRKWPILQVQDLDKDEEISFKEHHLRQFGNTLSAASGKVLLNGVSRDLIINHSALKNPLYGTIFFRTLKYLRDKDYDVNEFITHWHCKAHSLSDLYNEVLKAFKRKGGDDSESKEEFGSLIIHSLALLYASRHGLKMRELMSLLVKVKEKHLLVRSIEATTIPAEIKTLFAITRGKTRLIDIFRSFDTDGNGTLSRQEFQRGIEKLGVGISKNDIEALMAVVDENGDGEIDYNETSAYFDKNFREAIRLKRGTQMFSGGNLGHDIANRSTSAVSSFITGNYQSSYCTTKNKLFLSPNVIGDLLEALACLGVFYIRPEGVLILSFNGKLRNIVWNMFICNTKKEEEWHSYLIDFFMVEEPSLRRCEEIMWHLAFVGKFNALKNALVDLRTFDIMFNRDPLLKEELLCWLRFLSEGVWLAEDRDLSINFKGTNKKKLTPSFDIVDEYNHAVELFVHGINPSQDILSAMIHNIADFLSWFDEKNVVSDSPQFMRKGVDLTSLRDIGVNEQLLGTEDKTGPAQYLTEYYYFNRWLWIQYPWLALRNAAPITLEIEKDMAHKSSRISPPKLLESHHRYLDVKIQDPTKSRRKLSKSASSTRQSHIVKKSAYHEISRQLLIEDEKECKIIKDTDDKHKLESEIPFAYRTSRSHNRSRFSSVQKLNEEMIREKEELAYDIEERFGNQSIPTILAFEDDFHNRDYDKKVTDFDSILKKAINYRSVIDKLRIEKNNKQNLLNDITQHSRLRDIGDEKVHTEILKREDTIKLLEERLEYMKEINAKSTQLGALYSKIKKNLASNNPANDKKFLESLEQQLSLTKQQFDDFSRRKHELQNETRKIMKRGNPKYLQAVTKIRIRRRDIKERILGIELEREQRELSSRVNGQNHSNRFSIEPRRSSILSSKKLRNRRSADGNNIVVDYEYGSIASKMNDLPLIQHEQVNKFNHSLVGHLRYLLECSGSFECDRVSRFLQENIDLTHQLRKQQERCQNRIETSKLERKSLKAKIEMLAVVKSDDPVNEEESEESGSGRQLQRTVEELENRSSQNNRHLERNQQLLEEIKAGIYHICGLVRVGLHPQAECNESDDMLKLLPNLIADLSDIRVRKQTALNTTSSLDSRRLTDFKGVTSANNLVIRGITKRNKSKCTLSRAETGTKLNREIQDKDYDVNLHYDEAFMEEAKLDFINTALDTKDSRRALRKANILSDNKCVDRGLVVESILNEDKPNKKNDAIKQNRTRKKNYYRQQSSFKVIDRTSLKREGLSMQKQYDMP